MAKSKMFPFITCTWNPIGGRCPHNCIYCWSMGEKGLVSKYDMKKYQGKIYLVEKELKKNFKIDDFVFVQDMSDLFAECVPREYIIKVLDAVSRNSQARFLLLTKNPQRYFEFLDYFPKNVVLGVTIESNFDYPSISKAPSQLNRLNWITFIAYKTDLPIFISIEPILDFDWLFSHSIKSIKNLWAVAIGYDNYGNKLPEPKLEKTERLIKSFEDDGIKVFRKTLKKAWYE